MTPPKDARATAALNSAWRSKRRPSYKDTMFSADQLLDPISATSPAGEDLAFSPELDAISLARKFDDPSLDQGEWVTELKEADWDFVVTRCAKLLQEKSKDLRLAVWLAEAAAKQYHLRGLAESLKLLAGLCDDYWDLGLYPEADDGDNEQRIGNLAWILNRCPALLREMPLTEGRGTGYSTIDFETARKQASRNGDSSSSQPVEGVKLADMESARNKNSMAFMTQFRADADDCMAALLLLEQAADARLGPDSPGFSAARDAVQAMQRAMPAGAAAAPAPASDTSTPQDNSLVQAGAAVPGPQALLAPAGALQNRAQALAQLRQVAEFFRLTEPYSPVSYFADKAADAGSQDLHTWLRAVTPPVSHPAAPRYAPANSRP
jgi:type VI secretion system protein ImpA